MNSRLHGLPSPRDLRRIRFRYVCELVTFASLCLFAHGGLIWFVVSGCAEASPVHATEDVVVQDLDGDLVRPFTQVRPGVKGVVFLFTAVDCPISNAYSPELERIRTEYADEFEFYAVFADPRIRAKVAADHLREFSLGFTGLLDPEHQLVSLCEATITPEAAVLDLAGKLLYRGRIDDLYVDFGKRREEPDQRDLRAALDVIRAGERPAVTRTQAVGCFIPDA